VGAVVEDAASQPGSRCPRRRSPGTRPVACSTAGRASPHPV